MVELKISNYGIGYQNNMNNEDILLDDIFERISGIFGQYDSKRVAHIECLTHENL